MPIINYDYDAISFVINNDLLTSFTLFKEKYIKLTERQIFHVILFFLLTLVQVTVHYLMERTIVRPVFARASRQENRPV